MQPEPSLLRTQYIIIDHNSYSSEAVALALRLAHFANQSGQANIRLLFTGSLKAEIDHGKKLYYKQQINKKRQTGLPEKNCLEKFNFRDAINGYEQYIETDRNNPIDLQLEEEMIGHLCKMYHRDINRFYSVFNDNRMSVINPEQEIPRLLDNTKYFSQAYDSCLKSPDFRKTLQKLGLHKDIADKSVLEWYKTHIAAHPDTDVILVSMDNIFLDKMKKIYEERYPNDDAFKHFEHFSPHGFAEHIKQEMETWISDTTPEIAQGLEQAVTDLDRCYANMMAKKYSGLHDNDGSLQHLLR